MIYFHLVLLVHFHVELAAIVVALVIAFVVGRVRVVVVLDVRAQVGSGEVAVGCEGQDQGIFGGVGTGNRRGLAGGDPFTAVGLDVDGEPVGGELGQVAGKGGVGAGGTSSMVASPSSLIVAKL